MALHWMVFSDCCNHSPSELLANVRWYWLITEMTILQIVNIFADAVCKNKLLKMWRSVSAAEFYAYSTLVFYQHVSIFSCICVFANVMIYNYYILWFHVQLSLLFKMYFYFVFTVSHIWLVYCSVLKYTLMTFSLNKLIRGILIKKCSLIKWKSVLYKNKW